MLLAVDQVELLVEQVGPLLQPLLLLADLAAHRVGLGLELLAAAEHLLLGGEVGLAADGLGLAPRLGEDRLGDPARNRPGIAPPGRRRRSRPRHRRAVRGIRSRVHRPPHGTAFRPVRGAPTGHRPGQAPTPGLVHRFRMLGGRRTPSTAQTSIPRPRRWPRGGSIGWKGLPLGSSPSRHRAPGPRPGRLRARHCAPTSRGTPESECFPSRRSVRRQARGRAIRPAGDRPERPTGPTHEVRRHRPPPGQLHPQGHRRPEDGQCPDGSGPARRHARDPFSPFQIVGNVVGARPSPPQRPASPRSPRGSRFESPGIVHDQS